MKDGELVMPKRTEARGEGEGAERPGGLSGGLGCVKISDHDRHGAAGVFLSHGPYA